MFFSFRKTGNELIDDFIFLLEQDFLALDEKIKSDIFDSGETSRENVLNLENLKDKLFLSITSVEFIRKDIDNSLISDSKLFKLFFDKYTDLLARNVMRGDFNMEV